MTAPRKRTATGARLVDVPEVDPVAERGAALDELHAAYMEACAAADADRRDEVNAAWDRWRSTIDGHTSHYQSQVEHIRGKS